MSRKKEEEEPVPEGRKADIDLDALGEQLATRKQELQAVQGAGVPEPELKTMDEVSI